MAAMDRDVISLVQDALHPFSYAIVKTEVYGRRNILLKRLIKRIGWRSDKEKYEALNMIMMYWSHGSQPSSGENGEYASSWVPPEAAMLHEPPSGETDEMRELLVKIRTRLPAGDPFSDDESDDCEMEVKCETCEDNFAVTWAYPECATCHREHS